MAIKSPFTELEINRSKSGFYQGHSVEIALISKAILIGLVIWALIWPAMQTVRLAALMASTRRIQPILYHYSWIVFLFLNGRCDFAPNGQTRHGATR